MSCVCILDDDASVLKATSRLLRSAGFEVRAFARAQDYLAQLDPRAPGCLVLDLNMPGIDGLAVEQALARRGARPAIIFISGDPSLVEAGRDGAAGFLAKPVDGQSLVDAVNDAMRRAREMEAEDT